MKTNTLLAACLAALVSSCSCLPPSTAKKGGVCAKVQSGACSDSMSPSCRGECSPQACFCKPQKCHCAPKVVPKPKQAAHLAQKPTSTPTIPKAVPVLDAPGGARTGDPPFRPVRSLIFTRG